MSSTPGRPSGESDTRYQLLQQARILFSRYGYSNVSTRTIAAEANVNAAMIRYYFGNKAGLFEAVLAETLQPLNAYFQDCNRLKEIITPSMFISKYYQIMENSPDIPKLVFRSLHDTTSSEHQIVTKVFTRFILDLVGRLDRGLKDLKSYNASDLPFNYILITCISLATFPFLMPPAMLKFLNFEVNQESLQKLSEFHEKVLKKGLNYS